MMSPDPPRRIRAFFIFITESILVKRNPSYDLSINALVYPGIPDSRVL